MQACCNWCCTFVKVDETYDRRQHRVYCCRHCLEKDWLFNRWQSDKYLNWIAKEYKNGKAEDGGVPEV